MCVAMEILNGFYHKLWLANVSGVLNHPLHCTAIPSWGKHQNSCILFTFLCSFPGCLLFPRQCSGPGPALQLLSSCPQVSVTEAVVILQCRWAAVKGVWQHLPGLLNQKWTTGALGLGSPSQAGCVELTCSLEPGSVAILFHWRPQEPRSQLQGPCTAGQQRPLHCARGCFS